MKFIPLGDSALIIRLRDDSEGAMEEKASIEVLDALRRLEVAAIPGVVEWTSAYTTVALFYDPFRVVETGVPAGEVFSWLESAVRKALAGPLPNELTPPTPRLIEIPVCYEAELALDLDLVAQHARLSPDEVIRLHSAAEYRVQCLGFTPGFPYLSGLPKELTTPRRAGPRKEVPAGSIAIGGSQTGVYPLRSPGGWNVIGRTPLRMFDVRRDPPTVLSAGDRVRFRAITRAQFETLKQ